MKMVDRSEPQVHDAILREVMSEALSPAWMKAGQGNELFSDVLFSRLTIRRHLYYLELR